MTAMNTNSPKQQGNQPFSPWASQELQRSRSAQGHRFRGQRRRNFRHHGAERRGKSVLLRQLIGLEEPDKGEVLIEGQPIQSPDVPSRYRVAMVFQSGALLTSMTVGENVGFYLTEHHLKSPDEIAKIVAEDLDQVGLKGTENKMPDELSGGMRKARGHRPGFGRRTAVDSL
jgi:ABC-type transporter Mla maintaining outer membrane lipid asymmetry ATPase subunit MlaF